jgi:hypothetical protein
MKRTYFCPHCRSTLNPNVKIALVAMLREQRCLMLFSPKPGNYSVIVGDPLDLRPGDVVCFLCPVCQGDLTSEADPSLARLGFRLGSEVDGQVLFSRRFGEKATYFVTREEMRSYGEHAQTYAGVSTNFFGAGGDLE